MTSRRFTARAAAAVALAGGGALPATAQQRSEPLAQVSFVLDVRHDSNIARADANRAASRGLVRADDRATPSMQAVLNRSFGRNTISLQADAGYDFYRRNRRLNRERLSVGAVAGLALGPAALDLGATLYRRQSDPADIAPLLVPGTESVRNTENVQDYSAEARFGRSRYGLKPVATFAYSTGENSNPRRRIADYRTTRYGGGVSYESPVLGAIALQYLRDDTFYPNRAALLGQTGFTTDRIQLRGKRDLGAVLTATGSVSYLRLKPDQGAVSSYDSIGWNLALTATPRPDLQLTLGIARDTTPSLGTDALYQVGKTYSAGANFAFSRDMSLSLRGSLDDRRYVGSGLAFGTSLVDSVQHLVTASLAMNQTRRVGVTVDVGYTDRDANGTFFDYNSVYAGIRTSLKL